MSYKLPNKISLDLWWDELEKIMPGIKIEAGYMRYVPLNMLKFAKWAERVQSMCEKQYTKFGKLDFTDFDVETTALGPARKFEEGLAGVTDIAALKIINCEYLGNDIKIDGTQIEKENKFEFQTLCNPGISIPKNIQEITNITDEMVSNAKAQYLALIEFKKFSENSILVGHNIGDSLQNKAGYDITTVLGPIYRRYFNQNIDNLLSISVDTKPMFDGLIAGVPHTNELLSSMMGIKLVGAHRAMPDVRVNAKAFSKILPLVLKLNTEELKDFANTKLEEKNFYLTFLRSGADFRKNNKSWVEFGIRMDQKFNVKGRRSSTIIKYDPFEDKFLYDDIQLSNGTLIDKATVAKSMPEHVLRRQARILTKENNFYDAIEPFYDVVF